MRNLQKSLQGLHTCCEEMNIAKTKTMTMGSVLRLLTLNLGAWSTMDVTRVHITYHFNPKLGMSTIMHKLLQVSSSRQTYSHWECQWSHPCRFLTCSCKIMSSSGRHYAGTMTTHNAVCTNPTLGMSVITPILFAFINLAEDIMKIHWLESNRLHDQNEGLDSSSAAALCYLYCVCCPK